MRILGVDPGLKGGTVFINGRTVLASPMPVVSKGKKNEIDAATLATRIRHLMGQGWWSDDADYRADRICYLEQVGAMPKQGVTSCFSFGCGWGMIRGILAAYGVPCVLVRPQEWQKEVLKGHAKGSEAAVATSLFPGVEFRVGRSTKPHEGLVDAALIAEYGRRMQRS